MTKVNCRCHTCNKPIENPYVLDGKKYGYNCYKLALAKKYIHLQEFKNDDWTKKCVAAIELFRNVEFKNSKWNQEFQASVLTQWDTCNKLSGKQFGVIMKHVDNIDFNIVYLQLLEDEEKIHQLKLALENWISKDQLKLREYKNNELYHELVRYTHKRAIEKHDIKYYIIEYFDIDEPERIFISLFDNESLQRIQQDEFLKILEVIEV